MKILVFGPSGSGKTYVSQVLKSRGINAYDDADIKNVSSWYDRKRNKVAAPETAREALDNHYSFLWSKRGLKKFLDKFSEVYIFGGSGNIFNVLDLFDRTFFLKVAPYVQKERIFHSLRETSNMDFDENGIITWGDWIEEEAKKRNIPFIDATLSPGKIFDIISVIS